MVISGLSRKNYTQFVWGSYIPLMRWYPLLELGYKSIVMVSFAILCYAYYCVISFSTDHLLGVNLTVIPEFHSHLEAMFLLNPADYHKQVSICNK